MSGMDHERPASSPGTSPARKAPRSQASPDFEDIYASMKADEADDGRGRDLASCSQLHNLRFCVLLSAQSGEPITRLVSARRDTLKTGLKIVLSARQGGSDVFHSPGRFLADRPTDLRRRCQAHLKISSSPVRERQIKSIVNLVKP